MVRPEQKWIKEEFDSYEKRIKNLEKQVSDLLQLHKTQVSGSFIFVSEETPPSNIELLAKSPTGQIHLCNWRPAYNIFTCQSKRESSFDWQWKLVE